MESTPEFSCLEPLLNSNIAPLPSQISLVTEAVDLLSKKLDETDARIIRLQTELAQLETTSSTLREDLRKYSGILSPLRRIPPEIIRTIMVNCFSADSGTLDPSQAKNVALVSRQWYQIAIATPILWSSYVIDAKDDSATEGSNSISPTETASDADVPITFAVAQVRKASAHLAKAASLPLRLRCSIDCDAVENDVMLDYIHNLSPRMYDLHVNLHSEQRYNKAIAELNTALVKLFRPPTVWPMLTRLYTSLQSRNGNINECLKDVFPSPAQSFPALRDVDMGVTDRPSFEGRGTIQNWRMPWLQLSRLAFGPCFVEPQGIVDILRECSNLEECSLHLLWYSDRVGVTMGSHIVLPKLVYLSLEVENVWVSEAILDHLTLPALQSYYYDLRKTYGFELPDPCACYSIHQPAIDAILQPLTKLIERSSCSETLDSLDLNLSTGFEALEHTEGQIEDLFALTPRLRSFGVSGTESLTSGLLDFLPPTVDDLEVVITSHQLDGSRIAFVDCVTKQCDALQEANDGVPQRMRAQFRLGESEFGRSAKRAARGLQQGKHASAAKLQLTMD